MERLPPSSTYQGVCNDNYYVTKWQDSIDDNNSYLNSNEVYQHISSQNVRF